ncbi:hypothetical protein CDG77_23285 [Nostoc sp. 'Peltigera membranacea cyanobiont' 213]|nr:hypothetical protein CDG77_23285 [Nostoc sp. 'Peltigera membranacea cyanobiont' 213]
MSEDVDNWYFSKSDRISRLQENKKLEEAARAMLKHLGELKQPYLSPVEEKLWSLVEQEYGCDKE